MKEYEDERYCYHCEKDTIHICRDSGHERDSSRDYQECKECHWRAFGLGFKYQPPREIYK